LDWLGRRRTLMLINTPAALGWLLIATASHSESWFFFQVYAGRLLTGLATGMSSSPGTVYISEVVDKSLRGMMVTWSSIGKCTTVCCHGWSCSNIRVTPSCVAGISLGILMVYILGSFFPDNWRMVSGLTTCFPLASFIAVWFLLPESPVWLVSRGKIQEAEISMRHIRSVPREDSLPQNLEQELDVMMTHGLQQDNSSSSSWKDTLCFQQFSGIFVVVFYAVDIVRETGVHFDGYVATVLIGVSRLAMSVVVSFASKQHGRRLLCNISGVGMTLSIGALATFLTLTHDHILSRAAHGWWPIMALVMYILTSSVGFLTLPWAMIGEVFPTRIRGPACGATTCLGYLFSFAIVKLYPQMKHLWGNHGLFTFYAVMALLGTIFMYMYLPETQGRTLEQIEGQFMDKRRDRAERTLLEKLDEKVTKK